MDSCVYMYIQAFCERAFNREVCFVMLLLSHSEENKGLLENYSSLGSVAVFTAGESHQQSM